MSQFNISDDYTVEAYEADVKAHGLETVWDEIIQSIQAGNSYSGILSVDNLGELYEIGLAAEDKISKKELGQYYTPDDVATVMSEWLKELDGENVCDVCCGTGNLTVAYLDVIGEEEAKKILSEGRLWLYDLDPLAMKISQAIIGLLYGIELVGNIHCVEGDFLDQNVSLPPNSKVISNPPYARFSEIPETWEKTEVTTATKELYSTIFEKILKQSIGSVIITPYSFISAQKFYSLRKIMNDYSGFIVSFDNVPGSIFNGRKHGIFNTNSVNSVRAAITVANNREETKGFRCSSFIRFKPEERQRLLDVSVLEGFVGENHQLATDANPSFVKCHPSIEHILRAWKNTAGGNVLKSKLKKQGKYSICFPNTCRYFTTGAVKDLSRTGKNTYCVDDADEFYYLYCLINSSFCYWWWRLFDGGITYSKTLIDNMPDIYASLTDESKKTFKDIAKRMVADEDNYLVYKMNAGKPQENVKFPKAYRQEINRAILKAIGVEEDDEKLFYPVHANVAFLDDLQ